MFSQQTVSLWLPLAVGNQWTYEHELRHDPGNQGHVWRWQTVETITGTVNVPEGTVVVRRVDVKGDAPGGWLETVYGESNYLFRTDCLYFLDAQYSWNEAKQQLNRDYRSKLLAGKVQPEFCFPLIVGKEYGKDAPPGWIASRVVGMGIAHNLALTPTGDGWSPRPPPRISVSENSFDVVIHLFSADETHLWFEKGVGITGMWDLHHGTNEEYRVTLLRFQPAARP